MSKKKNKSTGDLGEDLASEYFKKRNYKIIDRNFRTRFGEIDIIAKHNDIFIFVEVKTKTGVDQGTPLEMVGRFKQDKLRKLALAYFQENYVNSEQQTFRIDVISVILQEGRNPEIEHLKNAVVTDK